MAEPCNCEAGAEQKILVMTFGAPNMQTSKEYRHNAAVCLKLASETREVYAKRALIDLAREFRALAEDLERVRRAAQY
jgi:hypothetical protein